MAKKVETQKEKRFHEELIGQMLILATTGFGLVAALAWNSAIQDFVNLYIVPNVPGSGIFSKVIYAILVTVLAVLITYQLSKLSSKISSK